MPQLYKIVLWIISSAAIGSQILFENVVRRAGGRAGLAHCLKCSNFNRRPKLGFIAPRSLDTPARSRAAADQVPSQVTDFVGINSEYLTQLNTIIYAINSKIINKDADECYAEFERIFSMLSDPVSSLFSEPVELDYKTKLDEINTRFGLSLDKIDPVLILKKHPYSKHGANVNLSYEYLTQEGGRDGKVATRLWRREFKDKVPRTIKKQMISAFTELSTTLGNFLSKFYQAEVPILDMIQRATSLGLVATTELFEGLSMLQLRDREKNRESDKTSPFYSIPEDPGGNLKRSLEVVESFSNIEEVRGRFYKKLIDTFFRKKDSESILAILKHLTGGFDKKINSIFLTQYLVALVHQFKDRISQLKPDGCDTEHDAPGGVADSQPVGGQAPKMSRRELYLELKEKIKSILQMYQKNHLHPFNMTRELAEIIDRNYRDVAPGLFTIGQVAPNGDEHSCESCGTQIRFRDVPAKHRLEIFSNLIKMIHATSPNELGPLHQFYSFLRRAKEAGNPYTCVIDGQNLGYSHNNTRVLNWFKIYYAFTFMSSLGERPVIVLPERPVNQLIAFLRNNDPKSLEVLNRLIRNKDLYLTRKYSYDDNFFLLAGISTFSEREASLFESYLSDAEEDDISEDYVNVFSGKRTPAGVYEEPEVPTVEDVEEDSGAEDEPRGKNTIVLTNDRLSNLRIEDIDTKFLDEWKLYSIVNFNVFKDGNREFFVLGQRLKYTFSLLEEDDRFHMPIGYDRIFTNSSETLKCNFNLPNSAGMVMKPYINLDTPIRNWIQSNTEYLYSDNGASGTLGAPDTNSPGPIQGQLGGGSGLGGHGTSRGVPRGRPGLMSAFGGTTPVMECEFYHKSPEIAQLMFSPTEKSNWLCVDLTALDRAASDS